MVLHVCSTGCSMFVRGVRALLDLSQAAMLNTGGNRFQGLGAEMQAENLDYNCNLTASALVNFWQLCSFILMWDFEPLSSCYARN